MIRAEKRAQEGLELHRGKVLEMLKGALQAGVLAGQSTYFFCVISRVSCLSRKSS